MAQRKFSTTWDGVPVEVTSQIVSRYAWMTASIDVSINDRTVLRTGGVMRISGDTVATFEHQGISHTVSLRWRKGSLRSFPFQLEIDGAPIADCRVPVQNWWSAFWPFTATLILLSCGTYFARYNSRSSRHRQRLARFIRTSYVAPRQIRTGRHDLPEVQFNGRLVMASFARQRTVAMAMQANIGKHSNCRVCTREPRLGAYPVNLRIGNMARGSVKQPFDGVRGRCDRLEAYAD